MVADGRLIAYVDWTGPRHRVFTVRANGGQPRLFRTFNDRADGDGYANDIDWQTRPRR